MPQAFVKIINRDSYTNVRKARHYVNRGLAAVVSASLSGQLLEIRMLESAELAIYRSHVRREDDQFDRDVTGVFEPFVGDSGGSQLMQQYTGMSGGTRVWMLDHKIPKDEPLAE